MTEQGAVLLINNDRIICPVCRQPLKIYGSAMATDQQPLYAAECTNTECAQLVRFEMNVRSVLCPSRIKDKGLRQER